jgi:hypothetical protein
MIDYSSFNNNALMRTLIRYMGTGSHTLLGVSVGTFAGYKSRMGVADVTETVPNFSEIARLLALLPSLKLLDTHGVLLDNPLAASKDVKQLLRDHWTSAEARKEKGRLAMANHQQKRKPEYEELLHAQIREVENMPVVEQVEDNASHNLAEAMAEVVSKKVVPAKLLAHWPNAVSMLDIKMTTHNGHSVHRCRTPLWDLKASSNALQFQYDLYAHSEDRYMCGNPTADEQTYNCAQCNKVLRTGTRYISKSAWSKTPIAATH